MDEQNSKKSSEIWLKYCEDCIKSKFNRNGDSISNLTPQRIKKNPSSL